MSNPYHNYNLRKRKLTNYNEDHLLQPLIISEEIENGVDYEDIKKKNEKNDKVYSEWPLLLFISILSIATRLYAINRSSIVVWDEAHFGKFANWYLKREFYFDVHPPLGKMLIAFFGWMFNYDGSFSFDSGSTYNENVPIFYMRVACALFGALVPPFMYGASRNLGTKRQTALLVCACCLFDNALLTISKFVLLDPILLGFTAASIYCATKFSTISGYPFTRRWKAWLFLTGLSLGLTSSIKWVGLFTYTFVGLFTMTDLWGMMKIIRREPGTYARHWIWRIAFLIILPCITYMATFVAHFAILNKSGPGDSHMSSLFQSNLENSPIISGPPVIAFQSLVTIRNKGYGAGLLHSHNNPYPGSKQPQVTLYHHRDHNNYWSIEKPWKNDKSREYLYDKEVIRLFHNSTRHNLHSHLLPSSISVFSNEVSTYGNSTIGDDKDHWIVHVVENGLFSDNPDKPYNRIQTLSTTFRLQHVVLGCYLASSGQKLPDWGFNQMEVVCTKDDVYYGRSLWNVEEHVNKFLDDIEEERVTRIEKRASFFNNFIDLNMAMWYGNNALTPKPGKKDLLVSTPSQWPFAHAGLRMCNWNENSVKYYLIGNPIVWWMGIISVFAFSINTGALYMKKEISGMISFSDERFIKLGSILSLGWVLHYIPFWIMGRVTYLHHYFPSLMVSFLTVGVMYDRWVAKRYKNSAYFTFFTITFLFSTFLYFSPLSYGFIGKSDTMAGRVWRENWNIV